MKGENPEWTKDLHKFYGTVRNCTLCRKKYGTDRKLDDGICPRCNQGMRETRNGQNSIVRRGLEFDDD